MIFTTCDSLTKFRVEFVAHDCHSLYSLPQKNSMYACRIRNYVCICKQIALIALITVNFTMVEPGPYCCLFT